MIAKKKQTDKKIEKREVPEYKIKIVADLADKMKKSRLANNTAACHI